MKIHLAVSLAVCVSASLIAEEAQKPLLTPLLEPANTAAAQPAASGTQTTPSEAQRATPVPQSTPAEPKPTPPAAIAIATNGSGIPFTAENKLTAKKVYGVINEIQRTGFDPQKNFALIAELQRVIAGSSFGSLKEIQGYIRASLNLNSLRSRDSKSEQGNTGSQENVNQKSRGVKLDATLSGPIIGGDLLSNDNSKAVASHTAGLTISSQTAYSDLGPAMQQQSAAYGKLLEELNASGFPEPILASQLYGKWKWHCEAVAATYEFDLQEDGSLNAEVIADDPTPAPNHATANKGRGEWKLDYRSLTLELHGSKLAVFWRQSPQTFLAGKQIKSIDEDEIILDTPQDNLLKRVKSRRNK